MNNTMEWQVTNREISTELKELGVPQESLWYWVDSYAWIIIRQDEIEKYWNKTIISAFTVAESGLALEKFIHKSWKTPSGWATSGLIDKIVDDENINTEEIFFYADTEANCRGKLRIHLIKNKIIEP